MSDQIFVAVPTYNGQIDADSAVMGQALASKRFAVHRESGRCSLLCVNFNTLLCSARIMGAKWFAMLHGDIIPEPYWADTLIGEAEAHGAHLVSAVVPIKDSRGLTSTAIDNPDDPWVVHCRITQSQINHPDFPDTFDAEAARGALGRLPEPLRVDVPEGRQLLVNTGCMVMRLDWEYADELYFENRDCIVKVDGEPVAMSQPEDWLISRQIACLGGKVMATRKVKVAHMGAAPYFSNKVWGESRDALLEVHNKGAVHV